MYIPIICSIMVSETPTPIRPKSRQVPSVSRSLSVSFQGEAFSLPVNQTKTTPLSQSLATDHNSNNNNIIIRQPNVTLGLKLGQSVNWMSSLHLLNRIGHDPDGNTDSGSSRGIQEYGLTRIRPSRIIVSPKFWQQTNTRMRRLQHSSSLLSTSLGPKANAAQKTLNSKRTMASPNKFMMGSSASRGVHSPRRNSVYGIDNNNIGEIPSSVLSFAVDVRRGKAGENRLLDAHVLRLLYNRQLQWRFVNARSEDIVLKQEHSVEENIWNAWITISDLRDSVTRKKHRLQILRLKLKLASILKAQIVFLEDWAYLDKNHSISLLGAIKALKASSLRLPVTAGATADLQSMNDAINSAADVMQAMGSSMNSLCLQVEEVNIMVTKIAKVSAKERALLRTYKDFLSVLSTLKVKDCSLRTHMLQTSCVNC